MTSLLVGLAGQIIIPAAGIGALAVIARSLGDYGAAAMAALLYEPRP